MLKKITLFLGFFFSIFISAQKLPEFVPPSPTVANLMKFEEVPINNYSGQPNISIPLFSKQIANGLEMNLSLNYSTSGVQIDSQSGWTGTSWSLFAGGTISRTVRDHPDEALEKDYGSVNKTGLLHINDYWFSQNLTQDEKGEFTWRVIGGLNKYDSELDLYQFNFMGYQGRFVIVKSGSQNIEAKLISRNVPFKIEINHTSSFEINSFTIIDAKGYKYIFDISEETNSNFMSGQKLQNSTNTSENSYSYNVKTAWHLSEVKLPSDINLVTFNYTDQINVSKTSRINFTENKILDLGFYRNDLLTNSYNKSILRPKEAISQNTTLTKTRKLSSIVFRDSVRVELTNKMGHPETSSVILEKIVIKSLNNIINKEFLFNYSESANRLWLTKVSEKAGGETLETKIKYNDKSLLPIFDIFVEEGDDWGYHSGINKEHTYAIPFNPNQIKTGLIKSIEYPTGGLKKFDFEHNSYSYVGDSLISYDDYMRNPLNSSHVNTSINSYTYSNPQTGNFPEIPIYNTTSNLTFTLDFQQDVYISTQIDDSSNSNFVNEHEIWVTDESGKPYGRVDLGATNVLIQNLPQGNYKFYFASKENESDVNYNIKLNNVKITYKKAKENPIKEMLGGGVRIKNISYYNDTLTTTPSKKINYEYFNKYNSTLSSGVVDGDIGKLERSHEVIDFHALFNNSSGENICSDLSTTKTTYFVTTKGKNIKMSQGSAIGYGYVKVSQNSTDLLAEVKNGYTTYSYTTAYDFPTPPASFQIFPRSIPSGNIDFKRGLLSEQVIFNSQKDTLKKVKNIYEFQEEFIYNEMAPYFKKSVSKQFYNRYEFYKDRILDITLLPRDVLDMPCSDEARNIELEFLALEGYFIPYNLGWAKLKESITKDYFYNNLNSSISKKVESKKVYTYNNENFQVANETYIYKENGIEKQLKTNYSYPKSNSSDLGTTSLVIDKLIALNKVNEILKSQTTLIKGIPTPNNPAKIINNNINIYNIINNDENLILPTKIKTSKGTQALEDRIVYHAYDDYGNPLEVSKKDGMHIVYLWGYNKTQPIAKIENATYTDVQNSLLSVDDIRFNSIEKLQALSNKDNDSEIAVVNNNGIMTKQGNESKLIEAHVSLRNALPNSMVTTFTYNPLIGVTSITNPRGEIIYYEYDNFNRIKYIKDSEGNVLKENQYKYKK